MRCPASGDHASRRFVGVTRAGLITMASWSLAGMSMVPRAARFCPRPVQFVQGELLSMRGAAIRVRCAVLRAFSPLSADDTQVVQTRDGPAFAARRRGGTLLVSLTARKGRLDDSTYDADQLLEQKHAGLRAVSSNARSEAATIPDTIPFLRLGLRFHPFVSPTLSAAIVELRVAACFRARDELISTNID